MGARGRPRGFDRDTVLRQAMLTFWEHGYEGTSMTDLTAAMGINSPSIYACFGSKEELFRAAVALYAELEGSETKRVLTQIPTVREAFAGMMRANADSIADLAKPPGCMIVLGTAAGTTKNADVRAFLAGLRQSMHSMLRARLDRAVAEGELPPGTDTEAIATFYLTVMMGMSLQARDGASRAELDGVITAAIGAWDGLTAARGRPHAEINALVSVRANSRRRLRWP